jgi:PAS domain S-box-containing protein
MTTTSILIVEDERIIAKGIEKRLEGMGYSIAGVASTGDESVRKAMALRPDMVLMDIHLGPGIDGIEAAGLIGDRVGAPVVYLTAHSDDATLQRAKLTEPFGYVLKPFEDKDLQTAIEMGLYKHKMDRRLRENEQWLAATLASIGDGVIATDEQGRVRFMNSLGEQLTGWTQTDTLGTDVQEVFHIVERQTRQPVTNPALDALQKQESTSLPPDTILISKTGVESHINDSAAPIRDASGQIVGSVLVFRDVTDRCRLEEQLRQARDDAEEASRTKDQFIAVMSHELRTPLAPVLTAVEMMETAPGFTADQRALIGLIRRNVQLEARLIDDLLDVNMIIRGKLQLQLETIDLNEMVRCSIRICESAIFANQLRLTATLDAKDRWVRADATRLQQILWNLLRNAAKFTPSGGAISVRTENLADDRVSVVIRDTGVGIEPEALTHIFDAFAQGNSGTTRQFGGLGLGLTIAQGLARMHGGTLTANSVGRGQGATFTLVLPTTSVTKSTLDRQVAADAGQMPQEATKLLLVEDDADTRELLAKIFRMHGYCVRVADSVGSALQAADSEPFDLLVSDLDLPDGSGMTLMTQLSAKQPIRGIILSGHGTEDDIRRTKVAGFAVHLTKPVPTKTLLQAVQDVLDSR